MPLKSDEIREMSDGDIHARIADLERERFNLRFEGATKPLENPMRLRTVRRDIARLKTILRERQLAAAAGGGPAGSAGARGRAGRGR